MHSPSFAAAAWRRVAGALPAVMLLATADCLRYSPHDLPPEHDLHRAAVAALAARPPGEVFRFAVVGDTQRAFEAAEDCVSALRRRDDLAFVVQLGDFTNMGLAFEYQAMNAIFARLEVPYFVVIGNHDLVANGQAIYEHMFGPLDLAFTYGRVRFVLLNTNGREFGFAPNVPDLDWLDRQLARDGAHDRAVVFGHSGTLDTEFNETMRSRFVELLRGAAGISMHGHAHKFEVWRDEDVVMFRVDSAEHRNFLVVAAGPDGFDVERVFF